MPVALSQGQTIALDEESGHYVRTVLRLKKASPMIVFNGSGGEYAATVAEVSRKNVLLTIDQWHDRCVESSLKLILGLGIARSDRMDLAVQKSVELGVNEITPVLTERSVLQLTEEKKTQRCLHWQKIVQHATEQCGRTTLPALNGIATFAEWIKRQQGLKLFLDPYAQMSLVELTPINNQVTLLTGPEGGFAAHERDSVKTLGFIPVCLGKRILRTETASLAALSAMQMLWGDFNNKGIE